MEKIRSVLNKALNLLAGLSMAVMVILLYSVLNIIGIVQGTIALDTSDEVSEAVAKAEADQTAEKEG